VTNGSATRQPARAGESNSGKPGWLARNTSVATRLAIGILLVSIVSLVGSVVIAVTGSAGDGEDLLHERLTSTAGARAAEINAYLGQVVSALEAMASGPMAIDGVQAFADGYAELEGLTFDEVDAERVDLAVFYLEQFVPILEDVRGEAVDVLDVSFGLDPAAVYLQSTYIARNPLPIDEKRLLTDGEDGSSWTEVHKNLHPIFRANADRLGFADLYLIEPENHTIVYSSNKTIDFATSLDNGPHSGTALAGLVRRVTAAGEAGAVRGVDFTIYDPDFDRPTAFAATPLFDGDTLVGVLAASLSDTAINEIMNREWQAGRLGATGEIYLVGTDGRMRSDSRAFQEDPEAYLARVDEAGTATVEEQNQMAALGTTVLFQDVDSPAVRAALQGESGIEKGTSYLGEEVYTAYQPVSVAAFDWALIVQQDQAAVDAPVNDYVRGNLLLTTVIVVALTFFAVAWASSFVNPLRAMSAALARIKDDPERAQVPSGGAREFRVLAEHLGVMVDDLTRRKQAVTDALSKKTSVLLALLPPAIADAVVGGDRQLVETVSSATVVVLTFDGLDDIFRTRDTAANRDLMHSVVDLADDIASASGLERVKVMGDAYFAVCGVETPYLDHVPRAARFAFDVRAELLRFAEEHGLDLDVSGGIDTGPVTVGLTGNARLIYDLWGETVEQASILAGVANDGRILVSDEARTRLPGGDGLLPFESDQASAWVANGSAVDRGPEA
jgi:class 3 adenylate cyclase